MGYGKYIRFGNWYHKISMKPAPCLVLKTRLRSGYQKDFCIVFVRHI